MVEISAAVQEGAGRRAMAFPRGVVQRGEAALFPDLLRGTE
jgi:hypothetical protein